VVPDASPHLIAAVYDEPRGRRVRVAIVGARSTFCDVDMVQRRLTVGVRLRPGTLPVLTRAAASLLTDTALPLDEVLGRSPAPLEDALASDDGEEALRHMLRLLRRLLPPARDPGSTFAAASAALSVAQLGRILGVSARTLQQRTHAEIGLAPKRMLRIVRLHRALAACAGGSGWAEAAHDHGYADQPHLVREMQALLGETPTSWRARRGAEQAAADSFKTRPRVRR
jgi:AraC-like DNA-binding protein